eukprot:gene29541-36606_t
MNGGNVHLGLTSLIGEEEEELVLVAVHPVEETVEEVLSVEEEVVVEAEDQLMTDHQLKLLVS